MSPLIPGVIPRCIAPLCVVVWVCALVCLVVMFQSATVVVMCGGWEEGRRGRGREGGRERERERERERDREGGGRQRERG